MEAHVVVAVEPVDEAGEDVLAAVLLGHVEPAHGIDAALDLRTYGQRPVGQVHDGAVAVVHIQHVRAAERTVVGALSAALREERRSVELDRVAPLPLVLAGDDLRRKRPELRVLIEQTNRHDMPSFR